MFYHTEAKAQGWRALAILADHTERLLFLGRSSTQVRAGYAAAYDEILDEEEKEQVREVSLQCWHGAPDQGHWLSKASLPVPADACLILRA